VRSWLDAKELRAGERLPEQINRAIQTHDKILLVLSRKSIQSVWVRRELEHALNLERSRGNTILFPLRLDDSIFTTDKENFGDLKDRVILDFGDWRDKHHYQRAFSSLVRDLAISASIEARTH
jgi:hypothetical protein